MSMRIRRALEIVNTLLEDYEVTKLCRADMMEVKQLLEEELEAEK